MEPVNDTLLLWAEEVTYPAGWTMISHEHPFFHLFFCREGTCTFLVDRQQTTLKKGDCLIVPPHFVHGIDEPLSESAVIDEIMFRVKDSHLLQSLSRLGIKAASDPFSRELLDFLVQFGISRLDYMKTYVTHSLFTLLAHFCMAVEDTSPAALNRQKINTAGFSLVSTKIVIYIDAHYMEPVSLDAISQSVDYNSSYVCTVFKKDTGITVNDYLNFVRIKQAAEYLSYTNLDIGTVCALSGFQNQSHFNRTFRKFLGVPPGYYKRMTPVNINDRVLEKFPEHVMGSELYAIAERLGTFQELDKAAGEV
jgi:AraC-like DNA-binding protein